MELLRGFWKLWCKGRARKTAAAGPAFFSEVGSSCGGFLRETLGLVFNMASILESTKSANGSKCSCQNGVAVARDV